MIGGWALGTTPLSAAGAPKAYLGSFKDDAVAVVDVGQNKVVTTIVVPKGPHGLVMTPNGRKAYVSSDGTSTVSVSDTATDRVTASIEVGANPHGLAVSAAGAELVAAEPLRVVGRRRRPDQAPQRPAPLATRLGRLRRRSVGAQRAQCSPLRKDAPELPSLRATARSRPAQHGRWLY